MVNLKISKLIPAETLKTELRLNGKLSHLNGIQRGDSTGEALIAIGKAMRDGKCTIGATSARLADFKISVINRLITELGLKYLKVGRFNNTDVVVTYDIYMSEGEIFRSIS